jgi:cytochrome c2
MILKEVKENLTKLNLELPLDQAMATKGENVSGVKCTSCHKSTDEKLVGPGWKGVTRKKKTRVDYEFYYKSRSND